MEWTPDEIETLRDRYPQDGVEGVQARLTNRSAKSIQCKARKLGIQHAARGPLRPWTPEEDAMVIAEYARLGTSPLASMLGKTRQAVKWRAWDLRVSHTPEKSAPLWSEDEIRVLKEQWEMGGLPAVRAALPDRTNQAIKTRVWEHIRPSDRTIAQRREDRQRHRAYRRT